MELMTETVCFRNVFLCPPILVQQRECIPAFGLCEQRVFEVNSRYYFKDKRRSNNMSLEDPFFTVRDEVFNALTKARHLYERWSDLKSDAGVGSKEELEWTTTELRNGLRSIEWDLEDLEETIGIVESNPKKFKIDDQEVANRRQFITQTKEEVTGMRENVVDISKNNKEKRSVASLMNSGLSFPASVTAPGAGGGGGAKYSRLQNEMDSPHRMQADTGIVIDESHQQQTMVENQENEMDKIKESVGTLKNIGRAINREIEEQSVMLDDLGHDIEVTDSRFDTTLKKVARVLRLNNDRRQWAVIGFLSLMLLVLIIFLLI